MCTIHNNAQIFPFGYLSKSELLDLYGIDMPSQLAMLPSFTVRSKLTKMSNLGDFDMDENLVHAINSNYISLSDLSSLKLTSSAFSLFHMNIRSLSAHFDELLQLLGTFKFNFDVIGIFGTKEKSSDGFLPNVTLPGYNLHSQPTKSSAGGVALYVRSSLDHKIRQDFSITKDQFEIISVEIISRNDRNTVCCCVYRHPNTEVQEFTNFISQALEKITKEGKNLFFMGDFNLNLLNYDTHSDTDDFFNLMIFKI